MRSSKAAEKYGHITAFWRLVERDGGGKVMVVPLAQIGGDAGDGLGDARFREWRQRAETLLRRIFSDRGVILVERGGGTNGFAENIALTEAGDVLGGETQPQLMRGAMGAEHCELSVLQF